MSPFEQAWRLLKDDDDFMRDYFYQTAKNSGIPEKEIDRAWEESQNRETPIPPGDPNNLHPGDEGELEAATEGSRVYFPTTKINREASPGIRRVVRHDDPSLGTFRDTPFNESTYFTTGEPMDLAWRLLKMPLYHGTTRERAEQIMREGLKPTSHAPQLFEMEPEEIRAAMIEAGRDPADYERLFGGDWNFAYGDQSGREPAISDAALYGGDDPAVIEIDENHPDAPQFMPEPYYPEIEDSDLDFFHDPLSQGFNRPKNQMRSNQTVPPSAMRILQPEEIPEREF